MEKIRLEYEKNILRILKLIQHPITKKLEENLNIFSLQELGQINEFIKTGNLNPIYDFLRKKRDEYLEILTSINYKKNLIKIEESRVKERLEMEDEQKEIETILFDI